MFMTSFKSLTRPKLIFFNLPDTKSGFIVSPLEGCSQKLRNLSRHQSSSTTGFSSLAVVKTTAKKNSCGKLNRFC